MLYPSQDAPPQLSEPDETDAIFYDVFVSHAGIPQFMLCTVNMLMCSEALSRVQVRASPLLGTSAMSSVVDQATSGCGLNHF